MDLLWLARGRGKKETQREREREGDLVSAVRERNQKAYEDAMRKLHRTLKKSDELEVPLTLGEWETSIRFVETHRLDMKTILQQEQ